MQIPRIMPLTGKIQKNFSLGCFFLVGKGISSLSNRRDLKYVFERAPVEYRYPDVEDIVDGVLGPRGRTKEPLDGTFPSFGNAGLDDDRDKLP